MIRSERRGGKTLWLVADPETEDIVPPLEFRSRREAVRWVARVGMLFMKTRVFTWILADASPEGRERMLADPALAEVMKGYRPPEER